LYRKLSDENYRSDSVYNLFGVNYFQYSKIEAEFRLKRNIDELNGIAFRFNSGVAIPYGNSNLVPYDKRYFIGGSNSLRAWQPRTLGPGNTPKGVASRIDRSGELLLEANIEYRFTIIKQFIESAIFFDAGNIWNLQKSGVANPLYGVISRQNFMKEVALNTGVGLRFDLSIFLFRLDWGMPLRDPSLPKNQRWILTERVKESGFGTYLLNESSLAIGIGYPF
jgi:outer membrane protein assembly factor BamA